MKPQSVSFIGAGNVAWHLAPALENSGHAVREVYSLKQKNAAALSERLYHAEIKSDLDFTTSTSNIFIIAVPDDAIQEVVNEIVLPESAILVHTSGSIPLDVLDGIPNIFTGVFYPLQTFTKSRKVIIEEIPFFIESMDEATEKVLVAMAKSISKKVVKASSDDRKALHVAAVFASNFTNHMLTLSKEVMFNNGLNFDHLKPLIAETLNKSLEIGPEKAQTGPAKRGDLQVLDIHMEFLKDDEAIAEIYRTVSQHIVTSYAD